MTEYIETPIQRILRENNERKVAIASEANIKVIANRLHNLNKLKANFCFVQNINEKAYRKKLAIIESTAKQTVVEQNQFSKTQSKINELSALIRHSNNVVGA